MLNRFYKAIAELIIILLSLIPVILVISIPIGIVTLLLDKIKNVLKRS